MVAAAGASVAGAGAPALIPRDGVFEIAAMSGAAARWPGAFAVPDLDQVAEPAVPG
jgi:hypothetical protein